MDKQTREVIENVIAIGVEYGMDIVGAIVLLVVGWTVAGWVRRVIRRTLDRVPALDETLKPFIANLVRYAVLIFVLSIAMFIALFKPSTEPQIFIFSYFRATALGFMALMAAYAVVSIRSAALSRTSRIKTSLPLPDSDDGATAASKSWVRNSFTAWATAFCWRDSNAK